MLIFRRHLSIFVRRKMDKIKCSKKNVYTEGLKKKLPCIL